MAVSQLPAICFWLYAAEGVVVLSGLKGFGSSCSWRKTWLIVCFSVGFNCTLKAQGFRLIYLSSESDRDRNVRRLLEDSGRLERAVEGLNGLLKLPETVKVMVGGEAGPLHDPARRFINIPYGFISELARSYPAESDILDVTVFVLYHEVGHALIDMFELPFPGEIEEAADALATLLSVELISEGGRPAYAVAQLMASQESSARSHPWFSQPEESGRFRQLICWLLGSDPGRLGWVAEDAGLEAEEADRCSIEYEEMRSYWLELLLPYLKR